MSPFGVGIEGRRRGEQNVRQAQDAMSLWNRMRQQALVRDAYLGMFAVCTKPHIQAEEGSDVRHALVDGCLTRQARLCFAPSSLCAFHASGDGN